MTCLVKNHRNGENSMKLADLSGNRLKDRVYPRNSVSTLLVFGKYGVQGVVSFLRPKWDDIIYGSIYLLMAGTLKFIYG